jgi:putative salt-induced outer membrane protein YdiY
MPRRLLVLGASLAAAGAAAQDCPCPPTPTPGWHGSAGAGLAVTSGNSDTQSYNLNLLLVYDPQRRNLVKIDGLYLKSRAEGEDTAEKSAFGVRDEFKFAAAICSGSCATSATASSSSSRWPRPPSARG